MDTTVAGLEADQATAQLMSGVERVHHATDLNFVRRMGWLILSSSLLAIGMGGWFALDDSRDRDRYRRWRDLQSRRSQVGCSEPRFSA